MLPGEVACTCNPSYLGDGDKEIAVQGQPEQKDYKTPSQPIKS
jgi:hypothetical protein